MGRVYLANHTELNRRCALKVLSSRISTSDVDFIDRFKSEGRATAALNHPNVVTIHSIGESDGHHFLEMEYVKGQSLQELLDEQGAFTPIRATVLSEGIAEGLAAAHREGILHRDLKPDNVLLTELGIPKLADFGLAKRIYTDDIEEDKVLVGTPNFMAPELFQGDPASSRSDVYSLGVCYFYMLTGRLPFASGSFSDLRNRAIHEPLPSIREANPQIPLELAECLSLLMEKSPKNRPRDGIEAAQLLHAVGGQVQDIESLLSEAFQNTEGISWIRKNSVYELTVELPDGRKQRLFIEPSEHTASDRLLLIYSICGPAHPDFFEEALRLNSVISHGGIALREIDGVRYFVMVNAYPRGSVDAVEVRRSVLEIAHQADKIENHLTGDDLH